MTTAKNFQPEGYHTATAYLHVNGAAKAIDFYKKVFGATEIMRLPGPDGKVAHAEIKIGDSIIMLGDEAPSMGALGPLTVGGTTVGIMLYFRDADAVFEKAIAAGGKSEQPMADQFYGDRNGTFSDPFGHKWTVGTHKEDVPEQEMMARMAKLKG